MMICFSSFSGHYFIPYSFQSSKAKAEHCYLGNQNLTLKACFCIIILPFYFLTCLKSKIDQLSHPPCCIWNAPENALFGQFRFNIIFIVISKYPEFQNAEFELFQWLLSYQIHYGIPPYLISVSNTLGM